MSGFDSLTPAKLPVIRYSQNVGKSVTDVRNRIGKSLRIVGSSTLQTSTDKIVSRRAVISHRGKQLIEESQKCSRINKWQDEASRKMNADGGDTVRRRSN